eukprot:6481683-Amphidinium_carterae.1
MERALRASPEEFAELQGQWSEHQRQYHESSQRLATGSMSASSQMPPPTMVQTEIRGRTPVRPPENLRGASQIRVPSTEPGSSQGRAPSQGRAASRTSRSRTPPPVRGNARQALLIESSLWSAFQYYDEVLIAHACAVNP